MKSFFKRNWLFLVCGIAILVLFFLRLYHLTALPVFADEAIYVRWAQVMKAEETLRFLPLSDGKEPLFMWVVIPFLKFIKDPLFAGRFVSVASGFATMIGVTFLSYLLFKSKKAALAAAVIYAVSPFAFFFDRLALVDSMLSMFGIWTFIFAFLAFTRDRWDFAMLAGFMLGGAWLTKSPALFFALMLPTLWFFAGWKRGAKNIFLRLVKLIGLMLPILIIGYGMYNILRLGPNFSMIARRNLDYVWPIGHFLISPLDPFKPWILQSWQWVWIMGPFGILALCLLGYLVNYKKYWRQLLVLTIWFLGPVLIQSEFAKVFTARYILFSIPYLVIVAASALGSENKLWLKILALILALFIAQSLVFDRWLLVDPQKANLPRSERSGYLEEWTAGQGIKETADYLRTEEAKDPKTKIVVGTEGFFGTLPDGLQVYLNDRPTVIVIGVGLNFDKIPASLVNSRKSGNKTYILVNSDRFDGNAKALGLTLLASYPKASRPDGSHQSLLFFKIQ